MSENLLAFPVLFPLFAGFLILWKLHKNGEPKMTTMLRVQLESVAVINSLVMFWLLRYHVGDTVVLFHLYGNLVLQLHLDGLGSVFAGLIAFLWPFAMLYAFEYMEHEKRQAAFFAYYLMTYGVTAGIALSGNFATLYLFYELLTLVTFPLVLYPLTKEAVAAARKYLYYSIGGAAFAFIGMVFILNFSVTGNSNFVPGGVISAEVSGQLKNILLLVYVMAFFGFGVKAAVFPFHGWLPKASVAPTPVTALLHAVAVVKSGVFAIMRLTYYSFGITFLRGTWAQYVVMAAAMVTIIYGSTSAVREVHFKRRLAYSTIANISYILFGVVQMSPLGLAAALSHMLAHAFMKITAFFCAGAVMHKADRHYIYELDGIGRRMPRTFFAFTISGLALMGIPMGVGFISKWNLAMAGMESGRILLGQGEKAGILPYMGICVILYSALMTGIYMLTIVVRAYFPKFLKIDFKELERRESEALSAKPTAKDPTWKMLVPLLVFCIVIVAFGVNAASVMKIVSAIGGEVG